MLSEIHNKSSSSFMQQHDETNIVKAQIHALYLPNGLFHLCMYVFSSPHVL